MYLCLIKKIRNSLTEFFLMFLKTLWHLTLSAARKSSSLKSIVEGQFIREYDIRIVVPGPAPH